MSKSKRFQLLSLKKPALILVSALILGAHSLAYADTLSNAKVLMGKGEYDNALTLINDGLKSDKKNESLLLLKGFILVKKNDLVAAEKYYKKLRRKVKNNPEVGNNLAMIYRMQKKYGKAIEEFQSTITRYPDYMRAYDNLGDTYVEMANAQYQRGAAATNDETLNRKAELSQNFHAVAIRSSSSAQVKETKPAPTAKPMKVAASDSQTAVLNSLKKWVNDWMSRDTERYFSNYSVDFTPQEGVTLEQWIERKKSVFSNTEYIRVRVTELSIDIPKDDRAIIKFKQQYQSSRYSGFNRKTLSMRKVNSTWLIDAEISTR